MDPSPSDVSYVTVRRRLRKGGEIPDYEVELYQESAPGVVNAGPDAHLVSDAIFGVLVVDNSFEHTAHRWFTGKAERFGWDVTWHDTLEAAELDLAERVAAVR